MESSESNPSVPEAGDSDPSAPQTRAPDASTPEAGAPDPSIPEVHAPDPSIPEAGAPNLPPRDSGESDPDLTKRQQETFSFIVDFIGRHGHPPTLAEIAAGIGARSVTSAVKLVDILERKGVLDRTDGRARAIRILGDEGSSPAHAPAGFTAPYPIPAGLNPADPRTSPSHGSSQRLPLLHRDGSGESPGFLVDHSLLAAAGRPDDCLLVYVGDSAMQGLGIRLGDLAIVEDSAGRGLVSGDLIACVLDGSTVLRRYQDTLLDVRLIPDDRFFPIVSCPKPVRSPRLIGRVLGLIRRY